MKHPIPRRKLLWSQKMAQEADAAEAPTEEAVAAEPQTA